MPKTKLVNKTNTAPDTAPVGYANPHRDGRHRLERRVETKFADGTVLVRTIRPSDLTTAQRNKVSSIIADAYAKALELEGYA